MNSRVGISVIALLLVAGCSSFGPLGTPDFEPTLRRDVPSVSGKLLYQAPGSLLYAVDGYDLLDTVLARAPASSLPDSPREYGLGVVVLTDQKLYFVKWSQTKYEQLWDLDYRQIDSLEVRSLGKGRRLVIKFSGQPAKVASFDMASDNGQTIDPQRTVVVCKLIAERSSKDCRQSQQ